MPPGFYADMNHPSLRHEVERGRWDARQEPKTKAQRSRRLLEAVDLWEQGKLREAAYAYGRFREIERAMSPQVVANRLLGVVHCI